MKDQTLDANRYYRYLTENLFDSRLSLELPIGNTANEGTRKLKFGGAYQKNDRQFDQYGYSIASGNQASQLISTHPISDPFSPDKFAIYPVVDANGYPINTVEKFYQNDGLATDHSFGHSSVKAGFAMVDYSINPRLRFAGGLRIEQADIYTDVTLYDSLHLVPNDPRRYIPGYGTTNPGALNELSYLPSANLIYKLKNDEVAPVNLRLNYSKTVARPSIRELSGIAMYDYDLRENVTGNPDLKMVQINNYDLRFESYFKSGDNVSVSLFYKEFLNHIELESFPNLGDYWINAQNKSSLKGIELEGKKVIVKHLEAMANVSLVDSRATLAESFKRSDGSFLIGDTVTRTMFGQAPYVVNCILSYSSDSLGLTATVSYNIQGSRIVIDGFGNIPDVYERPRNLVDLKVTKKLAKHFAVSIKVRDLLNAPIVRSYKFPAGFILDYDRYRYGTNYVLALSYNL